jgi:hypothetical protein
MCGIVEHLDHLTVNIPDICRIKLWAADLCVRLPCTLSKNRWDKLEDWLGRRRKFFSNVLESLWLDLDLSDE